MPGDAVDSQAVWRQERTRLPACREARRVCLSGWPAVALPVWPKKPSRRNGTLLCTVGVDSAKATVYGRLKIADPSPGFCHFSTERAADYFEQLLSEMLVTAYSGGVPIREWRRKKGVRGEAVDCRVYAFAALQALIAMGLWLDRECERIEMLAAKVRDQQPPRVSYSRWMQVPHDGPGRLSRDRGGGPRLDGVRYSL